MVCEVAPRCAMSSMRPAMNAARSATAPGWPRAQKANMNETELREQENCSGMEIASYLLVKKSGLVAF